MPLFSLLTWAGKSHLGGNHTVFKHKEAIAGVQLFFDTAEQKVQRIS